MSDEAPKYVSKIDRRQPFGLIRAQLIRAEPPLEIIFHRILPADRQLAHHVQREHRIGGERHGAIGRPGNLPHVIEHLRPTPTKPAQFVPPSIGAAGQIADAWLHLDAWRRPMLRARGVGIDHEESAKPRCHRVSRKIEQPPRTEHSEVGPLYAFSNPAPLRRLATLEMRFPKLA